jgi:ParB-like chromosome segregation protein Spo0J
MTIVQESSVVALGINLIQRDGGTQPRAKIHPLTVVEYAQDLEAGANFPPVVVFDDGTNYWLADGYHRVEAALSIGLTQIVAIVRHGTKREAVLYSVGANAKHGLRRSQADKRRSVMLLLEDEEWSQWSDSFGKLR